MRGKTSQWKKLIAYKKKLNQLKVYYKNDKKKKLIYFHNMLLDAEEKKNCVHKTHTYSTSTINVSLHICMYIHADVSSTAL